MSSSSNDVNSDRQVQTASPDPEVLRLDLLANGWEPLPDSGKACYLTGWPWIPIDAATIRGWSVDHPAYLNTGIRNGHVVAVDNDVVDPALAAKVDRLREQILGQTELRRIGSKGSIDCYWNDEPLHKITVTAGKGASVEILGARNQFVAFGEHPTTHQPFTWPLKSPLTAETWELRAAALTTRELLRQYAAAVRDLFVAEGFPGTTISGHMFDRRTDAQSVERRGGPICTANLKALLKHVSADAPYSEWAPTVMAIRTVNLSDGLEADLEAIACEWSASCAARHAKGGDEEVVRVFYSDDPDHPDARRIGTLIKLARATGYNGEIGTEPTRPAHETYAGAEHLGADSSAGLGPDDTEGDTEGDDEEELLALGRRLYPVFSPLEGANRPPLEFWDDGRLIGKAGSSGRVGLIVQISGGGKTTYEVGIGLDTWKAGARVLYCAGEGADDVMSQKLPAACMAAGITLGELTATGRWFTTPAVPLIANSRHVAAFIALFRAFNPDVIFMDTLAIAGMGLKENDNDGLAAHLHPQGNFGRIARELHADLQIAHHMGKDKTRGARGGSALSGNVDQEIHLTIDEKALTTEAYVAKMRGSSQERYSVFYGFEICPVITPAGLIIPGGVGAVRRINDAEAKHRRRAPPVTGGQKDPTKFDRADVGRALRENHIMDGATADSSQLARWVAGTTDRATVEAIRKTLNRGARKQFHDYVAHVGEGTGGAGTLWAFPPTESLTDTYDGAVEAVQDL